MLEIITWIQKPPQDINVAKSISENISTFKPNITRTLFNQSFCS